MSTQQTSTTITRKLAPHPECKPDEVYYGYSDQQTFDLCPFSSKRRGNVALEGGQPVLDRPEVRPIFVQRTDLEDAGLFYAEEIDEKP